jgi:hypothetical protein
VPLKGIFRKNKKGNEKRFPTLFNQWNVVFSSSYTHSTDTTVQGHDDFPNRNIPPILNISLQYLTTNLSQIHEVREEFLKKKEKNGEIGVHEHFFLR